MFMTFQRSFYFRCFLRVFLCVSCNGTLLTTYLAADYGTVRSPTKYFIIPVLSKYEYVSKVEVGDTS